MYVPSGYMYVWDAKTIEESIQRQETRYYLIVRKDNRLVKERVDSATYAKGNSRSENHHGLRITQKAKIDAPVLLISLNALSLQWFHLSDYTTWVRLLGIMEAAHTRLVSSTA